MLLFRRWFVSILFGGALLSAQTPEALLDAGHVKRARAYLEPRVKANPNDAHLAHLLSRVKLTYDDAPPAIALAEKSVALEPNNADYHTHFAHIYGWLAEDAPVFKQYQYVKALKREVEAALALNPTHIDALLIRAVFLYVAPSIVGGDRKESEAVVERMIKLNPERGYLARARIAAKSNAYGRMEQAFQQAVKANAESFDGLVGLGMLYSGENLRKPAEAERIGKDLLTAYPTRSGGYRVLARTYAAAQRWPELDAILAQSEKSVPDDLTPYYLAAQQLEIVRQDLPRAEQYSRRYLTQEREGDAPTHAAAHQVLGLIYAAEGKKSEAVAELHTAQKSQPGLPGLKKDLARVQ